MSPLDVLDTARKLADALLDLVPEPVAKQFLSEAAIRRANAAADALELAKFGKTGDGE